MCIKAPQAYIGSPGAGRWCIQTTAAGNRAVSADRCNRRGFALWSGGRAASRGICMDIKDDMTIQSWDGTWTYRPKVLVTPRTPEDIVEIVKSVVRFPSPVRP